MWSGALTRHDALASWGPMCRVLYRLVVSLQRLAVRLGRSKDLEIIVLRHQLTVLHRQNSRPALADEDRTLLGAVAAALPRRAGWLVTPETLLRWHRRRIARHWTQPSRPPGRPSTAAWLRRLIIEMATDNPTWGYRRVTAELVGLWLPRWSLHCVENPQTAPHRPRPAARECDLVSVPASCAPRPPLPVTSRPSTPPCCAAVPVVLHRHHQPRSLLRRPHRQPDGFLYDTAMRPEAIDKTLDLGVMPITPAPGSASGRHRRASLGDHTFTARDGTEHYRDVVVADDGSPAVVTTDSRSVETVVALQRQHIQWERDGQRHIAYGRYMMPGRAPVPASLRGASTLIRFNSTDEEALGGSSMRRPRALRAIPETDPAFAVFKSRLYAELAVADLERQAGSRLHASRDDVALSILTYQVLQLART